MPTAPIAPPDIDYIARGNTRKTAEGINTLWLGLNGIIAAEGQDYLVLRNTLNPKVLSSAPTTQQDDFDSQGSSVLQFTGASAWTLTGVRAGLAILLLVVNTGSGTLTMKHQSAASAAGNRFSFQAAADKTVATNKAVLLCYLSSQWQEVSFA